eukprot:scaffold60653_cov15-Prasinocladus_malaysianus.AAC.1
MLSTLRNALASAQIWLEGGKRNKFRVIASGAAAPWTPPKVLASENKGKKNYPKAYVFNKPQATHSDSPAELVTKHENGK